MRRLITTTLSNASTSLLFLIENLNDTKYLMDELSKRMYSA